MTIKYANPYFYHLFVDRAPQPISQASLSELLPPEEFQRVKDAFRTHIVNGCSIFDIETLVTITPEQSTWLLARCQYDRAKRTGTCVLLDITTRKQKENELRAQAKKARLSVVDGLTGLLTRTAVIGHVNELLSQQPRECHALVMIDIDCFKQVNDTMGHACGDQTLQMMAAALKEQLLDGDILGRLGGDEFVVCLCGISTVAALNVRLEQLRDCMHIACPHGSMLSGSMGAAVFPRDGASFKELYPKADAALYAAKGGGRNRAVVYQEGMTVKNVRPRK